MTKDKSGLCLSSQVRMKKKGQFWGALSNLLENLEQLQKL